MARMSMEQYQKKIKKWSKDIPDSVAKGMKRGGNIVHAEVIDKHLSGPKMARGVGHPTRATLARQTGRLANSITVKVEKGKKKVTGTIGTSVEYARQHEKGERIPGTNVKMPKRPYLAPSAQKKAPEVTKIILRTIMQDYEQQRVEGTT